jgi:hypothetical protein
MLNINVLLNVIEERGCEPGTAAVSTKPLNP